jgi:hypothetical protein
MTKLVSPQLRIFTTLGGQRYKIVMADGQDTEVLDRLADPELAAAAYMAAPCRNISTTTLPCIHGALHHAAWRQAQTGASDQAEGR